MRNGSKLIALSFGFHQLQCAVAHSAVACPIGANRKVLSGMILFLCPVLCLLLLCDGVSTNSIAPLLFDRVHILSQPIRLQ